MVYLMNKLAIKSVLALLLVSGCSTYSLAELRRTKPQGNEFQTALAKLYMDFSDAEEKDYDWQDSWYFADKGLLAIYGKDTAPEQLENWKLPAGELPHLKKARADLTSALTPEIMVKQPQAAARAQFYFDCWVEQQEENWQKDDIEYCRDSFVKALSKIDSDDIKISKASPKKISKKIPKKVTKKIDKKTIDKTPKESVKTTETPAAIAPTTTSFVVFFEPDKNIITTVADSTISEIIKSLGAQKDYSVVIIDKSKNKDSNLELSLERIQAIKARLTEAGIQESAIEPSNEKQINNKIKHKVEIFIND